MTRQLSDILKCMLGPATAHNTLSLDNKGYRGNVDHFHLNTQTFNQKDTLHYAPSLLACPTQTILSVHSHIHALLHNSGQRRPHRPQRTECSLGGRACCKRCSRTRADSSSPPLSLSSQSSGELPTERTEISCWNWHRSRRARDLD